MRIIFTGGGTGGHFYPIISVIEEMYEVAREQKIIKPELYFLAPDPYNRRILFDNDVTYKKIFAGKKRIYRSILNFLDIFKTGFGILQALWTVFWIYPDVIFSKGGYGSVPVVLAGRILRIPIIIHESDSAPGRANQWAAKFADKIALSYQGAVSFFDEEKVAWTGNPIRKEIKYPVAEGAHKYLGLETGIPVIFIMGGSQGAQIINESILDILPKLLPKYQVIHQTGKANFDQISKTAEVILGTSEYAHRYKPYAYLDDLAMRMSAGAANLIISRAGSTIFEIANWGIPSIIIPISTSNKDHQRKNAFNYARFEACSVIEESNLEPEILLAEIDRILGDTDLYQKMQAGAKEFAKPDAGKLIAEEILELALNHEK